MLQAPTLIILTKVIAQSNRLVLEKNQAAVENFVIKKLKEFLGRETFRSFSPLFSILFFGLTGNLTKNLDSCLQNSFFRQNPFNPGLLIYILICISLRTYQGCFISLIISSSPLNINVWDFERNLMALKSLQIQNYFKYSPP